MSTDGTTAQEPAWLQRLPAAQRRSMAAGRHRADPRRIGSMIAVIGGLVFVFSSGDGALPLPWLLAARIVAVALAALCVWCLLVAPRALGAPATPHRFAWLLYLGSVAAMLGAIALGRALLVSAGAAQAGPSWIAVCVGLHFIPFALAFGERMLTRLGLTVTVAGVAGVVLALVIGEPWGELGAIVAGLAQLTTLAVWAVRARPTHA
ncbi:hypothetical protein [Agrococcus sp. ARC_14]|uniref:hypothetical protein n=1 Tax=Agrococcus sp. ARC_14 TaxID=2919927 RepID=UPI001F06BE72|nr:hypothetical protein [Agrococcus sp. ARC_14]MCH1881497.1 hypothetical protein [Agrococcus sp. ARC_14]